ncbi:MAG: hypothetical protein GY791_08400 [Alphaproteobacteria bacterium]|nr:hypothetical protein [Alphaproteobacteria bacterium]
MPDFPRGLPVARPIEETAADPGVQAETSHLRQLEARAAAFPLAAGLMEEGAAALAARLDADTVPPADAVMADLDARLAARIDALPQPERAGLDGSRAALRDRVQRQAALRAAAGSGERIDRAVLDGIARQAAAVRAEPALFGLARDELGLLLDDLEVSGAHRADIERRAGQRLVRAAVTGTIAGEGGAAALDLLDNGAFDGVLAPDIADRLRTMARAAAATGDAERSACAAEAEALEAGRLAADMRAGRGDRTDILDAFADGHIGAATRDRLWRQAETRSEREIARRTDIAAVAARVAGDGPPLDLADPEDISAADRFYDDTVAPGLAELDPGVRGEAVADAVLQLGLVPAGARTFAALALSADDPALRQAGAAAIAAITAEAPELAAAFDERDVAFAETFTAAWRAGIDETEALQAGDEVAEEVREVDSRHEGVLDQAINRLTDDPKSAEATAVIIGQALVQENAVVEAGLAALTERWSAQSPESADEFVQRVLRARDAADTGAAHDFQEATLQLASFSPQTQTDLTSDPNTPERGSKPGEIETAVLPLAIPILIGLLLVGTAIVANEDAQRRRRGRRSVGEETFDAITDLLSPSIAPVDPPPSKVEGPRTDMPINTDQPETLEPTDMPEIQILPGPTIPDAPEGGIFIFPDESEEFSKPTIVENRRGLDPVKQLNDRIRDYVQNQGEKQGLDIIHYAGGRNAETGEDMPEFRIPGPGIAFVDPVTGKPGDTRPGSIHIDLAFLIRSEQKITLLLVQSIDVNKDGLPTDREARAIDRAWKAFDMDEKPIIVGIPKDGQLGKIERKLRTILDNQ